MSRSRYANLYKKNYYAANIMDKKSLTFFSPDRNIQYKGLIIIKHYYDFECQRERKSSLVKYPFGVCSEVPDR